MFINVFVTLSIEIIIVLQSRPLSSGTGAPTDNRKERSEREGKDREKRISRELSPLDHRGSSAPEADRKPSRRSSTREHSNNATGKSEQRAPCLSGVIYPLISEVSTIL